MPKTARYRAQLRRDGTDWYQIRNLADGAAEVIIYDEIGYLGVTAQGLIDELKAIQAQDITLRINSPGGEIFDGIAIMNALRSHPARVTAYVDGVAASIASVIAMAGDRVVMMPHSQLMIHDGSGLCIGNASDMREMAELLDRQSDNIAAIYKEKAGGLKTSWRNRMRAETWYTAEEAVKAGLADEVAKMTPRRRGDEDDPGMYNRAWDLTVYRYAGREHAPPPTMVDSAAALVDTAVGPHETDTEEGEWDVGENVGRLPSPVPLETARAVYAWYDAERVEDGAVPKDACKLPHHFVDPDGSPGAASMNGVRNALSRLPQTEGLSDEDRATIERHLSAHLEAGREEEEEEGQDGGEGGEARAQTDGLTAWTPDLFRAAMAKATEVLPEGYPDTFRAAVAAGAATASAIPQRAPAPSPDALGWRDPEPPEPPQPATVNDLFREAVEAHATAAPAVPERQPIHPSPDALGWRDPEPPEPPQSATVNDLFREAVHREAHQAPAVLPATEQQPDDPDPYDPTVITRALREATR